MWALAAIEPVVRPSSIPSPVPLLSDQGGPALSLEKQEQCDAIVMEPHGQADPVQQAEQASTEVSMLDSTQSTQVAEPHLQQQVAQLSQQLKELQAQHAEVLASKAVLLQQLHEERQSSQGLPRPVNGTLTEQDWDRLRLRMQKAERALEQERSNVDRMRHQLDAQRAAAAVGEHASITIKQLESDLGACQALAKQRTAEAEALQRALRLSDETVARLRGQLSGLLESNQAAMAREQEMEQKVQELHHQLKQQAAEASASVAAAQHMAHHGAQGLHEEVTKLRHEKEQLAQHVMEQDAALASVRAEVARKDAGIRALEKVLSHHGRHIPLPGPATAPATVTINMGGVADGHAGEEQVLTGGLTEGQWKLVMLSEAVRSLRATVQQLRQQAASSPPGQPLRLPPSSSQDGSTAGALVSSTQVPGVEEEPVEVMEVDLPPEEIRVRVASLAQQMLLLEEELQGYMQRGVGSPGTENSAVIQHGVQGAAVAGTVGTSAQQAAWETPTMATAVGGRGLRGSEDGLLGRLQRQGQKRGRRRGWWAWFTGKQDEGVTMV